MAKDASSFVAFIAISDDWGRWSAGAKGVDAGWITERPKVSDMKTGMQQATSVERPPERSLGKCGVAMKTRG